LRWCSLVCPSVKTFPVDCDVINLKTYFLCSNVPGYRHVEWYRLWFKWRKIFFFFIIIIMVQWKDLTILFVYFFRSLL
jgi:hypothetical protein